MTDLHPIFVPKSSERTGTVVFVHGLGGSLDTWQCISGRSASLWPKWLEKDLQSVAIYCLAYDASPTKWRGHAMEMDERARNGIEILRVYDVGEFPLAFVCHSYGGLLIKAILRELHNKQDHDPECKKIFDMIQGIVFLSTPHNGSKLADFFSRLNYSAAYSIDCRTSTSNRGAN